MTHLRLKIAFGAIVLTGAIGYLAYSGIQSGWVYFVEVDQFVANADLHNQRVRLCGHASEQAFDARPAKLQANFNLTGAAASLPVAYRGVVPNTFVPGCEVVVEGRLNGAGVFQADSMMTKCASKYEAEDHAERLSDAREARP